MSLVVIPRFAAAEDDAPRTEWAVKTEVSMPAASSRDLSHLARVLDVTALCGLIRARNNLVSPPLQVTVITGHSPGSCGKEGKKNSVIGFPCLDCLARLFGVKATPAGLYCFPLRFS